MSRFRSRDNGGRAGPRPRRHNTRVRSDWESPTTSNAPPVEIPLSPWAERFPDTLAAWGRPTWVLDGDKRHSGFAIEYPSRDPKFYNDAIFDPDANPERPLNGPDLHRLFLSEAKQRISLRGLATWQAGPLNSWVDFGNAIGPVSGGNRTVDSLNNDLQTVWERGRIEVDESKWFPVFSRAHWYDLRGDATTVLSPEPPNGSFSVDDPNVWDTLKISLELADRIIKALIQDGHDVLKTILCGNFMLWKDADPGTEPTPEALVLLPYAEEVRLAAKHNRPVPTDPFANMSDADISSHLASQFEILSGQTFWSVMMDKPPGLTRGTTIRQGKLVALNLLFVKNLSHPDLTLAERCHLHFAVSKTIIHELCHALFQQRFLQRNMNGAKEPFYDFKEVAEMGEVLEFGMFGGRCEVKPFSRTLPIAANIHTWPGVDESTSAGKISSRLDKPRDAFVIHVHAAWLSKLLSRDFWNDASIPRKSDNFFHRTNVVRMDTITRREWPYRANIELRDVTVETDQSRWSNVEVDVMNAWNQRHHEWTLERNLWFNEERTRWDNSPWGIPNWINYAMADFAKAFAEKDYHQCRRCIQLVGLNRTGGIRWLDTPFTAALPPTSAHGDIWYFFAIGLLMTAALPIRQLSDPPPPVPQTPRVLHRYVPSRESLRVATERGLDLEDPIILSLPQRSKGVPTTPPYYNPFGKNPTEAIPPTQLGHLQVLDSILQHIRQQGAVVSGPWFRKIAEASASIQNERIQLNIRHPSNHLSQAIAKWDFTPPGYDPQNMGWVRWSLDRKQFEEVPGYQPPQPTTSAHGLA